MCFCKFNFAKVAVKDVSEIVIVVSLHLEQKVIFQRNPENSLLY